MKPFIRYLLLILIALNSSSVFALVDISCLKYEPAVVNLIGILKAKIYPGAPNFVSVEAGDAPETVYYIELRPPICTITKEETWMLGHERISEVQLAMLKIQFDQLGAYLGGVVSIKGSLFEAMDGHHHTPVLIDVKSFEGTNKNESTVSAKPASVIKPLPKAIKPIIAKSHTIVKKKK